LVDKTQINKVSDNTNINQSQANKILNKLENLLSQDDTTSQDVFLESETLLLKIHGAKINELGEQIALFNYPNALSIIHSIK